MTPKKIVAITDTDFRTTGYFNLAMPLLNGLGKLGHKIWLAGLGYKGEEHNWNFSIIPALDLRECQSIVNNLDQLEQIDVLIVALDIPIQKFILEMLAQQNPNRKFKYIGIFPVEADPLSFNWAAGVINMDKIFIISEFGTKEAQKFYVPAEHLVIGMDTSMWRPPTEEEKLSLRGAYGIPEDNFVVLSIADNNERKNWPIMCKTMSKVIDALEGERKVTYVAVSRLNFPHGWDFDGMGQRYGIQNNWIKLERGLPFPALWGLYALSDAYLLLSKAEGMSYTTLEAMALGLPVVATNCTAQIEHLENNRGFLVPYLESDEFDFPVCDPFGNAHRYFANSQVAADILVKLSRGEITHDRKGALAYIEGRQWKNTILQVHDVLESWDNREDGNNG